MERRRRELPFSKRILGSVMLTFHIANWNSFTKLDMFLYELLQSSYTLLCFSL